MFIITPDSNTAINLTRFYPDAFTDHSANLSWSAPSKPVANGSNKSLGIFKGQTTLSLSGCVAGSQSLNKQNQDPFEGATNRTLAACNMIEAIGDARDCMTVIPGDGKIYENMVLVGAPIRHETGGVMTFDLNFVKIEPFEISETFDAALGQTVNIGEVATVTGQPDNLPQLPENLFADSREQAILSCINTCGVANVICLDSCYANAGIEI